METGCVKITPAHDPNDFEVGRRHNLPEICMMNDDATISVPGKYFGMDRYEARKAMVEDLKEQGLLVKVVPHAHNVGTHDRCKTTVEPMVKQQWFVKMEEMAKPAIEALKNGDLKFVPENFGKTYLHCWRGSRTGASPDSCGGGHRIPAYYCDDCGEMVVSREMPGEMSQVRLHPSDPGRGHPGHLVLLRPVALLHPGMAGSDAGDGVFLPHQRAGDRLRHHLLLGGENGVLRPGADGDSAL